MDVCEIQLVVRYVKRLLPPLLIVAFAVSPCIALAQAQPVTVDVNGTAVAFDQPPIERAGRVFVPLRGVFERLGASVVYENGTINATSGSHQISLQIGQTTATVDGAPQNLDTPPFLISGRTLVPLRFISQALGATVAFDQATQTVSVTPPAPPAIAVRPPPRQAPPPPPPIAIGLLRLEPARDATVNAMRPELAATFAEPVDANSVRVSLDGRDVTQETYVSDRSFVYDPSFDLPEGSHAIVVSGRTPAREPFREGWAFATSGIQHNYISGLEPPNGTPARTGFTVSGFTRPGSALHVIATTSEAIANFSEVAVGSISTDGTADGNGYFAVHVELPSRAESLVDVRIASTSPDGNIAVRTLRLQR